MRHRRALFALSLAATVAAPAAARADAASDDPKSPGPAPAAVASARVDHANPRLKLSYRGFGVTGLDGNAVSLKGGQLDVYPVSRRFFRLGLEAEAGSGDAAMSSGSANVWYGVGGLSAGFQYPARVTPFVEGRFAVGAIGGSYSGAVGSYGGQTVSVSNASATTLLYLGGVDAGVEVYTVGRLYLSAAIGWVHPVYTGLDYAAMQSDPSGGMQLRQVASDTFTFKVGVGI